MLDDDDKLGKKPEDSDEELSLTEDNIFAEHELDITSPEELEAMEDITLSEEILGYNEDNTSTELLEDFLQQEETPTESSPPSSPSQDIFETDAFEDINSEPLFDYDPNATSDAGSSDGVFANIETDAGDLAFSDDSSTQTQQTQSKKGGGLQEVFQNMVHGIIAKLPGKLRDKLPVKSANPAPAMAGGGSGGNYKRQRLMRLLSMVFMVMMVYSLLRTCMGGGTDKDMENVVLEGGANVAPPAAALEELPNALTEMTVVTEEPTGVEVQEESAEQVLGSADTEADIDFEEPGETAETTEPVETAEVTSEPLSTDVTVTVASGETTPVALDDETVQELQDLGLMIPEGSEAFQVKLPRNPGEITQPAGVTSKLSDLESSLMAIDDRLDELNFQMRDERISKIENIVSGVDAPETQAMLVQTLKKMEEIDQKLSRLNDLQKEMRALDLEIKSVKADIVQQSTIVGEQQKGINDSMALAKEQQNTPPQILVQATIPGRAWLRAETGELLTVIPGDDIPGYGRVISIDAATGTVVMSSRVVFREQ